MVIDFLKKYSFVDDDRFAARIVNNSMKFKRVGKNRIKQDLYIKGIDSAMIDKTLSDIDQDEELENAIYLAEKRLAKIKSDDKKVLRSKLYQHLFYKGFGYDTINSALRHVLDI